MTTAAEFRIALAVLVIGCAFKLLNVFLLRFDSDEPQHLHVVWAWTQGLVQYRDLFDNHMPLFQLACAPILGLLGEHAAVLYWMRLLMIPLYVVALCCVYRIGQITFSRNVGVWAALLVSAISAYHFCSTEFRTDNAWTVLWLLGLVVITRRPFELRSLMVAGLLLGLAFGVSMKTTLMLTTIVSAFGIAVALVGWRRLHLSAARLGAGAAIFSVCMAVVPLIIFAFFAAQGIWSQFVHCVFTHNLEPPTTKIYLKPLMFVFGAPTVIYITRQLVRNEANPVVAFRRAFVCLTCGMYFFLMQGFWRHLTREDYLALFPLLGLVIVALLGKASDFLERRGIMPPLLRTVQLPAVVTSLVLVLDLGLRLPLTNEAAKEINRVRDVLAVTRRSDLVFDCKGEAVFRNRSVRYVLESITSGRVERGEMPDDFETQPPQSRARVAVIGGELSEYAEEFIEHNYLPVGHGIMVAGYALPGASSPETPHHFHVAMADRYQVVTGNGDSVPGLLDGTTANGARFLDVGEHTFVSDMTGVPLAILWAQAVERHFTNFLTAPAPRPVYRPTPVREGGRRIVDMADDVPDPFFRPITFLSGAP
ncbi:MAG: ArnT family glycosyltransferase [Chthoniobacterales bacterium]